MEAHGLRTLQPHMRLTPQASCIPSEVIDGYTRKCGIRLRLTHPCPKVLCCLSYPSHYASYIHTCVCPSRGISIEPYVRFSSPWFVILVQELGVSVWTLVLSGPLGAASSRLFSSFICLFFCTASVWIFLALLPFFISLHAILSS